MIVRAAIMFENGGIVEGHAYGRITATAHKLGFNGQKLYGFTTSTGEFVLPKEAKIIAVQSEQVPIDIDVLTPEDLWPSGEVE